MGAGTVIYAAELERMSAFYAAATGLRVSRSEPNYVVLESATFQLVLHAIPAEIAVTFEIADPPVRREDAAVKPVFEVPSIGVARKAAADHGGQLDEPEREWQFERWVVCDGHDPEGNVVQFREPII
jgi:catechol 2,3-dioxygenase-like lactoylglutathione lyase family enzyme